MSVVLAPGGGHEGVCREGEWASFTRGGILPGGADGGGVEGGRGGDVALGREGGRGGREGGRGK